MAERPPVPEQVLRRLQQIVSRLPECHQEPAWVGVRWRVGQATVAHVFGGEDGQIRLVFRAAAEEVMAFEHLGEPYFRAGWGSDVVGLVLRPDADWAELAELITDSFRVQAPARLTALLDADPSDRPTDSADPPARPSRPTRRAHPGSSPG